MSGEEGRSRQILKPSLVTEPSADQLSDEATTPLGPLEPEYVTPSTVTLSQHDSVEKDELVRAAGCVNVTEHAWLLPYVPEDEPPHPGQLGEHTQVLLDPLA